MKDGPEKTDAIRKAREKAAASGVAGAQRVFVGRTTKNEAAVILADSNGKPRIVMSVQGAKTGSLQFLDENGKVISSLPAASAPGR